MYLHPAWSLKYSTLILLIVQHCHFGTCDELLHAHTEVPPVLGNQFSSSQFSWVHWFGVSPQTRFALQKKSFLWICWACIVGVSTPPTRILAAILRENWSGTGCTRLDGTFFFVCMKKNNHLHFFGNYLYK
uniref:Secreted protein n=1 Tax=Ixodes ricinus TaxID=34613 RepID=A0A6B0URP0_IXORI